MLCDIILLVQPKTLKCIGTGNRAMINGGEWEEIKYN